MTLAAVFCCAMTTTVLTACGGNDDGDVPGPDKTPVAGKMTASYQVSEDMLKYLTISVEYYDADGNVKKEQMDKTEWAKEVKAKLPAKVGARLLMKLKDGVDASTITSIAFSRTYAYKCVAVTSSDAEVGEGKAGGMSQSVTLNGEKLVALLEKHATEGFDKFLYILDGKTITSTSWE